MFAKIYARLTALQGPLFWALGALVAAAAVYVHFAAGLTLPVPSNDEAFFLWQARAFQLTGGFIAPELDPTRPILILPLLYQALLGAVFKLVGASYEVARHFSLALTLAGGALLMLVARRHPTPLIMLALLGGLMLNVHFVVMANQVRMEPLFFVALCGGLLLMRQGHDWLGLAVFAIAPMIHPNGMFYLVPALVLAIASRGLLKQRPSRAAWAVLGIAAFVWLAHGIYVLRYWEGFVHDCAYRFGEMQSGTGAAAVRSFGWEQALALAAIAMVGFVAWLRRVRVGIFVAFAIGAWINGYARLEEPYEPFKDMLFLCLAFATLEIAATGFDIPKLLAGLRAAAQARVAALARVPDALIKTGALAGLGFMFALFLHVTERIMGPRNYLQDLTQSGMHVAAPGAYINDDDMRVIQGFIRAYEPGRPIVVELYPWSHSFIVANFQDRRVAYQVPYFDPIFRPPEQWLWGYSGTEGAVPDLYLIHHSTHTPPHLQYRTQAMIDRARAHPEVAAPEIILERGATDTWYALRAGRDGAPGARAP